MVLLFSYILIFLLEILISKFARILMFSFTYLNIIFSFLNECLNFGELKYFQAIFNRIVFIFQVNLTFLVYVQCDHK